MNEKCTKYHEAFVETCWKGVTEIIIALRHDDIHYGMFYAGQWRPPEFSPPDGLTKKFYTEYNKLPCLPPPEEIEELKDILTVFSSGILTLLKKQNAFRKVPDTRGNQIMEFIKNHAIEKIELSDVAAHLNLSCSRTSYIIHDAFNKTFPALVREERLRRVQTLLSSTNMTLHEIAVQTGFGDEYYLSRIFKRENGETPGQYRRQHAHVSKNAIKFFS